jgi:anti-sigma regulatory factor (Ser/Thr protein kinase)
MRGMAGRSAFEQSQRVTVGGVRDWAPGVANDTAVSLDSLGDPSVDWVCLPSRPESAVTCRRLARSVLRLWALPQQAETVEQLVSELVGNAVRHTGARTFSLRMRRRRGWVRAEVRDPSRALPCLVPVRGLDTSGRGLLLVDKLADRWGVDLLPRGKTTWFELRSR